MPAPLHFPCWAASGSAVIFFCVFPLFARFGRQTVNEIIFLQRELFRNAGFDSLPGLQAEIAIASDKIKFNADAIKGAVGNACRINRALDYAGPSALLAIGLCCGGLGLGFLGSTEAGKGDRRILAVIFEDQSTGIGQIGSHDPRVNILPGFALSGRPAERQPLVAGAGEISVAEFDDARHGWLLGAWPVGCDGSQDSQRVGFVNKTFY